MNTLLYIYIFISWIQSNIIISMIALKHITYRSFSRPPSDSPELVPICPTWGPTFGPCGPRTSSEFGPDTGPGTGPGYGPDYRTRSRTREQFVLGPGPDSSPDLVPDLRTSMTGA